MFRKYDQNHEFRSKNKRWIKQKTAKVNEISNDKKKKDTYAEFVCSLLNHSFVKNNIVCLVLFIFFNIPNAPLLGFKFRLCIFGVQKINIVL